MKYNILVLALALQTILVLATLSTISKVSENQAKEKNRETSVRLQELDQRKEEFKKSLIIKCQELTAYTDRLDFGYRDCLNEVLEKELKTI